MGTFPPPKAQHHGISTTVDQIPGTRGPGGGQIMVSTRSSISGQISVNLIFCRVWLVKFFKMTHFKAIVHLAIVGPVPVD